MQPSSDHEVPVPRGCKFFDTVIEGLRPKEDEIPHYLVVVSDGPKFGSAFVPEPHLGSKLQEAREHGFQVHRVYGEITAADRASTVVGYSLLGATQDTLDLSLEALDRILTN